MADTVNTGSMACLVGGSIGSLAAAAFMIRDGGFAGQNISIFEAAPVMGGSLDGAGEPVGGYSLRGGRMFTTDNYECTWDLFRSIPSLTNPGKTVFEDTVEFNEKHRSNALAASLGIRGILHTDYESTRAQLAALGLSVDESASGYFP